LAQHRSVVLNKRLIVISGIAIVVVSIGVGFAAHRRAALPSTTGESSIQAEQPVDEAADLESKNEFLQAREVYQKILNDHPDYKDIEKVQKQLEDLNMRILFSALETPQTTLYEVVAGDSLKKVAKQFNTTIDFLKKSNGLASDTIRIGRRLRIWKGVFSIFIDKSQNSLILKSDNEVLKVYRVATGKNNSTPVGNFKIVDKLENPTWFKSGAIVPPNSPENALGTRWLGFDIPGYGIHGTIDSQSIGQQTTEGCVRMLNEDVEGLYTILPVGAQVTITD